MQTPVKDATPARVFDADFMRQLAELEILTKKMFRGKLRGEKRSRKTGQSVEFHDYRQYQPGDDIRRVDWNLYARLERHFIKLFVEEEDLTLYILLDCSKSMNYGAPNKFEYARRLAAAFSYISLSSLERVQVAVFDARLKVIQRPIRGRSKYIRLFEILESQRADGESSLSAAVNQFIASKPLPGVVLVISDFLFDNPTHSLSGLAGRGNQVVLAQVLSPDEIRPDLAGDLELVDSESGKSVSVSMGSGVFRRYMAGVAKLQSEIKTWTRKTGSDFVIIPTSRSLRDALLKDMRGLILR